MRRSIGYGVYGDHAESFGGSSPIRLVQAEATVTAKGEVNQERTYKFEAGATPLMILVALTGGSAFIYLIYNYFLK